jgi:hypothetical protein
MVVLDRMNGEQFEGNGVPARDLRMWLVLGRKCLIQPPAILPPVASSEIYVSTSLFMPLRILPATLHLTPIALFSC